ncbi:DEAD/DEAH box helicase [Corynebacterium stationis]|uniref:DEAD/DEAH box helicase n=1 Tax=Corynebacterium stationis TaxID=1705 RepID=UPI0028B0E954|nr:DEAD/DEAH box helicase [Corynebacterium stationis]
MSFGEELLSALKPRFSTSALTHSVTQPAKKAHYTEWPHWALPELVEVFKNRDIHAPYSHQREVADAAFAGRDVVVATGTSSGKSLGYQLPILTRMAEDSTACALYLTPTKALGSDQLLAIMELTKGIDKLSSVIPSPYDGDTPTEARAGIRDHARFVFSNPDMVHMSILAAHERWTRFLRHLEFIVIDECHSYRGVFGAHVALVLRRILRICARYGAHPTIIGASATMNDPGAHMQRLTSRVGFTEVTDDGAPTGERTIALWEPGFIEGAEGDNGAPVRRAATTEAAEIMAATVGEGARTLAFVRSRRSAEQVALRCQTELSGALARPDFAQRIASYRAGYLAEDRRKLEKALDNGELLGVATTSALELGIDVGGLDAVVTAGFPGTVASFWQQAGRAGRRGQGSLVVFVARDEPMDTYLVHNPDALLGRPVEASVFNPENPYILYGHIYCACIEQPLTDAEVRFYRAEQVIQELARQGLIRRRPQGWFAVPQLDSDLRPETAHSQVSLRGGAGNDVLIMDTSDGRLLGTVDGARANSQVHPGAVYLHQGESFIIDDLDINEGIAFATPGEPEYSTQPNSTTDIAIMGAANEDELKDYGGGVWAALVDVEVTDQVVGYFRKLADGTTSDLFPLDLPEQRLRTRAVAYTVDPLALEAMGIRAADIPGALHAAEHAAIGLLPLIATCDRWDIGGVSTALHQDTQMPTVFVYDGHSGGAGFAEEGFKRFPEWIAATFEAVRSCPCESGCPSCVQSPKCGNGNQPLDKAGALKLLGALVTLTAS